MSKEKFTYTKEECIKKANDHVQANWTLTYPEYQRMRIARDMFGEQSQQYVELLEEYGKACAEVTVTFNPCDQETPFVLHDM